MFWVPLSSASPSFDARWMGHLLVELLAGDDLALILHVAQSDERQAEVGQGHEVARRAYRPLLVDHGADAAVEELHEALHGVELRATVAVGERLDLEQDHQPYHVAGHAVALATGVAHHEIDLQLRQLVLADAHLAERSEARRHAVDGRVGGGDLLVQVLAAARDARLGVVGEPQLIVVAQDGAHGVERQMLGADIMDFAFHWFFLCFIGAGVRRCSILLLSVVVAAGRAVSCRGAGALWRFCGLLPRKGICSAAIGALSRCDSAPMGR